MNRADLWGGTHREIAWLDVPVNELFLCTAAKPTPTCFVISRASFTSSGPKRLIRLSTVCPSTNSIA
jgi:hypothetical protein